MLVMVKKGTRGGMCHAIHQYAKADKKYMKDYDKNKESLYLNYWDVVLNGLQKHFNLAKILWKSTMKRVLNYIFLKFMFNILKSYINFIIIYPICLKE